MHKRPLGERDIVIWDADGALLYSYAKMFGGMEGAKIACGAVKVMAVMELLHSLAPEMAFETGKRSYEETGDGLLYFEDVAVKEGWDRAHFREQISILYHRKQIEVFSVSHPAMFMPCPETNGFFDGMGKNVRHAVLSQSNRDHFILPTMDSQKIRNRFDPDFIWGFSEFKNQEKSVNGNAIGMQMAAMGVAADRVVFVEDTKKNLRACAKDHPDIYTVHIADWEKTNPEDSFVDLSVGSKLEFMGIFCAARRGISPRLQTAHNGLGFHP